jgi:hypothetical protein
VQPQHERNCVLPPAVRCGHRVLQQPVLVLAPSSLASARQAATWAPHATDRQPAHYDTGDPACCRTRPRSVHSVHPAKNTSLQRTGATARFTERRRPRHHAVDCLTRRERELRGVCMWLAARPHNTQLPATQPVLKPTPSKVVNALKLGVTTDHQHLSQVPGYPVRAHASAVMTCCFFFSTAAAHHRLTCATICPAAKACLSIRTYRSTGPTAAQLFNP